MPSDEPKPFHGRVHGPAASASPGPRTHQGRPHHRPGACTATANPGTARRGSVNPAFHLAPGMPRTVRRPGGPVPKGAPDAGHGCFPVPVTGPRRGARQRDLAGPAATRPAVRRRALAHRPVGHARHGCPGNPQADRSGQSHRSNGGREPGCQTASGRAQGRFHHAPGSRARGRGRTGRGARRHCGPPRITLPPGRRTGGPAHGDMTPPACAYPPHHESTGSFPATGLRQCQGPVDHP